MTHKGDIYGNSRAQPKGFEFPLPSVSGPSPHVIKLRLDLDTQDLHVTGVGWDGAETIIKLNDIGDNSVGLHAFLVFPYHVCVTIRTLMSMGLLGEQVLKM